MKPTEDQFIAGAVFTYTDLDNRVRTAQFCHTCGLPFLWFKDADGKTIGQPITSESAARAWHMNTDYIERVVRVIREDRGEVEVIRRPRHA